MNEDELPSKLLALARRDLRAAEILRDEPDVGDGIVGFHIQQAAEKTLKAWLTILGIDFPRTHDLSLLIHKLSDADVEVTSLWELLDLNPFAVQLRYEILEDEPLNHGATLEQVTALLSHVEGLLAEEKGDPGDPVDS
ncbi:MAG: HEPN domain-containing protein [Thermoanaerobaculia bacterium]